MKTVLISQRFLRGSRNGISRDADTLALAAGENPELEFQEIANSDAGALGKMVVIAKTVFWKCPAIYDAGTLPSLLPHLENYLPNTKHSALIRIHDIFPITNPEWFHKISAASFNITLKRAVLDEQLFLCNSRYTQERFLSYFPNAKTVLLYCNPVREEMQPCGECQFCQTGYRHRHKRYLIAISTVEPRKNYLRLLKCWVKISRNFDRELVIVGRYGWKSRVTMCLIRYSGRSVNYLSDVCNFGVERLISNAEAYISASLDEGFNFSAMDAARAGIPLILSDIPVHRELYGDTALYFDPKNEEDIKVALSSNYEIKPIISSDYLNKARDFKSDLSWLVNSVVPEMEKTQR